MVSGKKPKSMDELKAMVEEYARRVESLRDRNSESSILRSMEPCMKSGCYHFEFEFEHHKLTFRLHVINCL